MSTTPHWKTPITLSEGKHYFEGKYFPSKRVQELLSPQEITELVDRTRNVAKILKGSGAAQPYESVNDERKVLVVAGLVGNIWNELSVIKKAQVLMARKEVFSIISMHEPPGPNNFPR